MEELPLTEVEICAVDTSRFPNVRVSMKVLRDSVSYEDLAEVLGVAGAGVLISRPRSSNSGVHSAFSASSDHRPRKKRLRRRSSLKADKSLRRGRRPLGAISGLPYC